MFDILTIGEMLIDLTQTGVSDQGIPVYTAFPGGAPANVAVAAAKLGASTAFIGKVGDDAFGKLLVDTVKNNGVNADGMIVTDTANTTPLPHRDLQFRFTGEEYGRDHHL